MAGGMACWSCNRVPKVRHHRRVLGESIRVRRCSLKYSQEKLAEKADLTPAYLSDVERGVATISVDRLVRLAKALDINLTELVLDCID
jgi:transcriptional regulator with XRE-family HTH domain